MRAFNVVMALLVGLGIVLLAVEIALRLVGKGPPETGLRFDPTLGWALEADNAFTNEGRDFSARIETDAHGLRDDYHGPAAKPAGVTRVLCLGDSFTLGYTVARRHLFADMLEGLWRDQGRAIEVVNAGVQGYSTDQELAWLETHGKAWEPDVVVLFPYENDLYWNLQDSYSGSPKPVYDDHGRRMTGELEDTGRRSAIERTAIGNVLFHRTPPPRRHAVAGTDARILAEQAVVLVSPPPFVIDAERRTTAILHAMGAAAKKLGATLVVCPVPSRSQVDARYADAVMGGRVLRLDRAAWDPELPYAMLRQAASTGSDHVLDPLPRLREAEARGARQYHELDWHLSPDGNHTLAQFLHDELDARSLVPPAARSATLAAPERIGRGVPGWVILFLALWLGLGALFVRTYRDERPLPAFLKVGAMLAAVFAIAVGGMALVGLLPPLFARLVVLGALATILGFVLYKLGDRLGTAFELLKAFTLRGHWYLIPLLSVLVTIGSLLVVAASSPLVAPFIYTLF